MVSHRENLYKPLDDGCFRVLRLHPSLETQAPIFGTLVTIDSRKSMPRYEALSYRWESNGQSGRVECDGISVEIQSNCYAALLRLRRPRAFRSIFVDAICINQNDKKERATQVMLMGSIYKAAEQVIVWLGNGNPKDLAAVQQAFQDFKRLYRLHCLVEFRRHGYVVRNGVLTRKFRRALYNSKPSILGRLVPSDGGNRFKLWHKFTDVPYFERVWTLQETALAKRSILHYGPYTVDLRAAEFANMLMAPYGREMKADIDFTPTRHRRNSGFTAHATAHSVYVDGKRHKGLGSDSFRREIMTTLDYVSRLDVTVPHDRLYGLYGLLSQIYPGPLPPPDYSLSLADVWLDGSWLIIRLVRTLDVLFSVLNDGECKEHRHRLLCKSICDEQKQPGTTCKASRWTYQFETSYAGAGDWFDALNLSETTPRGTSWDLEPSLLSATDQIQGSKYSETTCSALLIRGRVISCVHKTSEQPQFLQEKLLKFNGPRITSEDASEMTYFFQMTQVLADFFRLVPALCQGRDYLRSLHESMTWDTNSIVLFGPSYHKKRDEKAIFKAWFDLITRLKEGELSQPFDDFGLETLLTITDLFTIGSPEYHRTICIRLMYKRLFITNSGRLGTSWYCIREGDLVVLLCWARLPAILRPVESQCSQGKKAYLLVGFACIPGLNDCNKWDMREELLEEFALI